MNLRPNIILGVLREMQNFVDKKMYEQIVGQPQLGM